MPVARSIASLTNATLLVKGTGVIIFPLYASPPMPSSAIQHVSLRSDTVKIRQKCEYLKYNKI